MKVILCKPNEKPKVVNIPKKHTYLDIKTYLEIESPLTCVPRKIGNKNYDFWCDDEGLYKEDKYITAICTNAEEILVGNVLIARHDTEGNLIGLTQKEIEQIINPLNFMDNKMFSKKNGLITIDYNGFGPVCMNDNGSILAYKIW